MDAEVFIQFKYESLSNLELYNVEKVKVDLRNGIIKVNHCGGFLHVDLHDVSSFYCDKITPEYIYN